MAYFIEKKPGKDQAFMHCFHVFVQSLSGIPFQKVALGRCPQRMSESGSSFRFPGSRIPRHFLVNPSHRIPLSF